MTQNSFKGIPEIQIRHDPIASLYPLRDGGLMSTSADLGYGKQREATVWNSFTGLAKMTLRGHTKDIRDICQLDNGLVATASSEDQTIILWMIEQQSDKPQQVLVHENTYKWDKCNICPLSNGHLASGYNYNVIVWNSNTRRQMLTLYVNDSISSLLQLNNGLLAVGTEGKTIWLNDLESGESVMAFKDHPKRIKCMCQLNDNTLVSGSDFTIKMWDVRSGKCSMTLDPTPIWSMCRLNDGRLLTASFDRKVVIWNEQTGKKEMIVPKRGHTVCQLIDERVAIGNFTGEIDLLN